MGQAIYIYKNKVIKNQIKLAFASCQGEKQTKVKN